MFDLKGQVAVLTGGASAIGMSIAENLLEAGAKVALLGRSEKTLKESAEKLDSNTESLKTFVCDVRDEKSLAQVRTEMTKQWRKVDILVTCAAAPAQSGPSHLLNFESWRELLSVDLDGVFLACKTFGTAMLENRYGRIVNLTSFHNVATYPERAAYNAAKSGVEGLTRALAVEWGRHGITVNAVAPGPIRTPRTNFFLSKDPANEKGMLGRTPNARLGEGSDVAATVRFLVSNEARHVNGQQIVLDGGWTKNAWWGSHVE